MILVLFTTVLILCIGSIVFLLIIGRRPTQSNLLMSVLGSGGHTHEMLTLVKSLIDNSDSATNRIREFNQINNSLIKKIIFIASEDDNFCEEKLDQTFPQWRNSDEESEIKYDLHRIKRSRQVHQSYLTSIWTTLASLFDSWKILRGICPGILLCNGPGVCIPIVIVTKLLSPQTTIVFVESFCRTRSLSLTGKIIYHAGLAHHFMVQWPKLAEKYPKAKFIGLLV